METIRLGARLRAARKAAGYRTSKEFLKKNKIPASTYSQHESGARMPDDEMLKFYSKIFLVNFEWLKTGNGLPYLHSDSTSTTILKEELLDLKKFKYNSSINQHILTHALSELLCIHKLQIPDQTIKTIVKNTIKIYESIASFDGSNKNKMKMLKKIINEYKKGLH